MIRKTFKRGLTYDDFVTLAGRKPNLNGNWIYRMSRKVISEITKDMYPQFDIYEEPTIWFLTFEDAEKRIKKLVNSDAKNGFGRTYCFQINQVPVGCPAENGASWLYDSSGRLIDYSITTWTGDDLSVAFFGRPKERNRFKRGDIVEVMSGDEVKLSLLTENAPSVDWCWDVYQRCLNDGEESIPYFLDASDDCCYLIDGPGHEYHDHVSPLRIMKPRFHIPAEIESKMRGWLDALDRESEKNNHM